MKKYSPNPINVSQVEMPKDLNKLMEQIAEQVHEVWAAKRIEEGWQFGLERDDRLKTHPCLIPYAELPESEKEYDRETAKQSLKLIMKLGYHVERKE